MASQLELGVSSGARGRSDTLSGTLGALGCDNIGYSTRPIFTFTPQRGDTCAKQRTEPVSSPVEPSRVSGSDIVAAAKAGCQLQQGVRQGQIALILPVGGR